MSEINVTPLVDVMLVLLIIFMVSAPMLTAGVSVDLPRAAAPQMDIDRDQPIITVQKDERIFLGEEEVPIGQLAQRIRDNAAIQSQNEVYVRADETVPYGAVVRVLAIVREVGIGKMGLVTDPLERGKK